MNKNKINNETDFDFGNANDAQKEAIATTNGPLLIIAGPGTGKTFTLVKRAVYLIEKCNVKPEQIMMATFTQKAAKEITTRITNELSERNIYVNINEMYVGTFHSLCLRIIEENLELSNLKKNFRTLEQFDQFYAVYSNMKKFEERVANFNLVILEKFSQWGKAVKIADLVNNITEELVEPEELRNSNDPEIIILSDIIKVYRDILAEENLLDFSSIQKEAYNILKNHPEVLKKIQEKIQYIMVDEYQDTNYIQEQITFLLAGKNKNICVVGDDDQGLYRFRGATIRNILEFPNKFKENECKKVTLEINYRSNSDIVNFYNEWMKKTTNENGDFYFDWEIYRYDKNIKAHKQSTLNSPAVIKIDYKENILSLLKQLKETGKIKDYNQVAFLFRSVKNDQVLELMNFLEGNGINVYSPRSSKFFYRYEIKAALGVLMLLFGNYINTLRNFSKSERENHEYHFSCIKCAMEILNKDEKFFTWVKYIGSKHTHLEKNTDYAFSKLLYQIFAFEPFKSMLDADLKSSVIKLRASRNLASLTKIIDKYEYLKNISVFSKEKIDHQVEGFFEYFLVLLLMENINEYEDEREYAPSGCVSFLTIHQSKGLEFPIVFVGSLNTTPKDSFVDNLIKKVEISHFKRQTFEPSHNIKFFDFWRLYYTAFSRAQNLLVLCCLPDRYHDFPFASYCFSDFCKNMKTPESQNFNINEFEFETIKDVKLKETLSFTSHILVYETCALQYKFFKELEFAPARQGATLFGRLVHETIEDIHKKAISNQIDQITDTNIKTWLDDNYKGLLQAEHSHLGKAQIEAALKQVLSYAKKQEGKWDLIKEAEIDVSLTEKGKDYIIEGTIDLVKGKGDTIEIIDFKTEKKPDLETDKDRIENYRRQLHLYAHLFEERTGKKVSKMQLYYTGENNGEEPTITFDYKKENIDETIKNIDNVAKKIINKDFSHNCNNARTCANCDFKGYCHKAITIK